MGWVRAFSFRLSAVVGIGAVATLEGGNGGAFAMRVTGGSATAIGAPAGRGTCGGGAGKERTVLGAAAGALDDCAGLGGRELLGAGRELLGAGRELLGGGRELLGGGRELLGAGCELLGGGRASLGSGCAYSLVTAVCSLASGLLKGSSCWMSVGRSSSCAKSGTACIVSSSCAASTKVGRSSDSVMTSKGMLGTVGASSSEGGSFFFAAMTGTVVYEDQRELEV